MNFYNPRLRSRTWGMLLTPFTSEGDKVDHESLARLVEAHRTEGMDGLIALGVIAEPSDLTVRERLQVLGTVIESAASCEVVASAMWLDEASRTSELNRIGSRFASDLTAVMIPVVSPQPSQVREAIVSAHERTGLPVIVQDYPASTGVSMDVDDLIEALDDLECVAAVKCEAAPTFLRIRQLHRALPHLDLMSGLGGLSLVADLECGANSVACGITRPGELALAMQHWRNGYGELAQQVVGRIGSLINFEIQARTSISIRKEHWKRRGVIAHSTVRSGSIAYPDVSNISTVLGYPQLTDSATTGADERPAIHDQRLLGRDVRQETQR